MKYQIFVLGTVLMLLPAFAANAQTPVNDAQFSSQSYEVHESSTQSSEFTTEPGSVVRTGRERSDRTERSQITADLLNYPSSQRPRILVRCRQESFFDELSEGLPDRPQREQASSYSSIRELLSNREDEEIVIEVRGNCNDIRIQIEAARQQAQPYSGQLSHPEAYPYPIWNEEPDRDDWLTRTGSGWDWFLRRSATPPAQND